MATTFVAVRKTHRVLSIARWTRLPTGLRPDAAQEPLQTSRRLEQHFYAQPVGHRLAVQGSGQETPMLAHLRDCQRVKLWKSTGGADFGLADSAIIQHERPN